MYVRQFLLFSFALLLVGGASLAEVIVTTDGSQITGELVGYEGGFYHLRIGKFVKKIPEGRVKEIRDEGTPPTVPAPAAETVKPSTSTGGSFSNLLGGSSSPNSGASRAETENILKDAMKLQNENPMIKSLIGAGQGGASAGGSGALSAGGNLEELKQLQGNPALEAYVNRFKDQKFQATFLRELEAMQRELNPEEKNPHIDTLKALFDQLNAVGQEPAGADTQR